MSSGPPLDYVLPEWATTLYTQFMRGRHAVIHGVVEDIHMFDGRYLPTPDLVSELLATAGYQLVVRYDLSDGIGVADEFSPLYDRLAPWRTAQPSGTPPGPSPASAAPSPSGSTTAAPNLREQHLAQRLGANQSGSGRPRITDPSEAIAVFRRLLTNSTTSVAIVVEFAELMLEAPPRDEAQRREVALRKALRDAVEITGADGVRRRNTVALLTDRPARLPAWLQAGSPLVATVGIGAPEVQERRAILSERFPAGPTLPAVARPDVIESLTVLTEGLSGRDLLALPATSEISAVPPTSSKKLVAAHRLSARKNPWDHLDRARVDRAAERLTRRVIGQERAITSVVDMLRTSLVGVDLASSASSRSSRPRGVFFFVGPTGVGKTELAKALAELLFDDESAMLRLDMSEYKEPHQGDRLVGSPPGYLGHDAGGVLTNWAFAHPFSVVLFDEIEKAHASVFDKFLQLIDEGRLTDGRGLTADLSQSILIFTSNAGSDELIRRMQASPGEFPSYDEVRELFEHAVRRRLAEDLGRPELYARFGNGIVAFDLIRPAVANDICRKFLTNLTASAKERRRLNFEFPDNSVAAHVLEVLMNQPRMLELGARAIANPLMEELVRVPFARWWLANNVPDGATVRLSMRDGQLHCEITAS